MATKHTPTRERVTLDEGGRLLVPDAVMAELTAAFGHQIDIHAELLKAQAWASENITQRRGENHIRLVRSWMLRAACEVERGRPLVLSMSRPMPALASHNAQPSGSERRGSLSLVR